MEKWKKWLNADYAFSNNGEKIKKGVKGLYTISLVLFLVAATFGFIGVLITMFDGAFEYLWYVPLLIIFAVLLAPFLIYWSLSFLYGYGELISNSYGNGGGSRVVETVIEKKTNSINLIEIIAEFFKKYAKIVVICLVILLLIIGSILVLNYYDRNNISEEEAISAAKDELWSELEGRLDYGEYIDYKIYTVEKHSGEDLGNGNIKTTNGWCVRLRGTIRQEGFSYGSTDSIVKSYFVYLDDDNDMAIDEIVE